MQFHKKILCGAGVLTMLIAAPVLAADKNTYELTIKDHCFDLAEIKVPADKSVILHVKNIDAEPEEFDSDDLGVEKVITGKGEVIIRLHPLKAGSYKFEGEYHSDTAHGVVIAE